MRLIHQILNSIRYGAATDEATEELNKVVLACRETGKSGSVTIKLTFKPGVGPQMEIHDDIKSVIPKPAKAATFMFDTEDGDLQLNDPRQRSIEGLREVEDTPREMRQVN